MAKGLIIPEIKLQDVMAFRTIYALCDVSKDKGLKATHFVCVLSFGRSPIWGMFSVGTGKLTRFFGSRSDIEKAYPKKAWRTKQADWTLQRVHETLDQKEKEKALRAQMKPEKRQTATTSKGEAVADNVIKLPVQQAG